MMRVCEHQFMTRMCQFIYFDDFSLQFTVMNFAYAKCYDMSASLLPIQPSNCKLVRRHNHNCKRATALIVESLPYNATRKIVFCTAPTPLSFSREALADRRIKAGRNRTVTLISDFDPSLRSRMTVGLASTTRKCLTALSMNWLSP